MKYIRARVPGSCGEWIQGRKNGKTFLLTCPVGLYATAEVRCLRGSAEKNALPPKAAAVVDLLCERAMVSVFPYDITLSSTIPIGKGMASSTADCIAVAACVSRALGLSLSPQELGHIVSSIDPVDGVYLRGFALIEPATGHLYDTFSPIPNGYMAIVDSGGVIDTIELYEKSDAYTVEKSPEAISALSMIRRDFSLRTLGKGATMSSLAHQKYIVKPKLEALIEKSTSMGAVGVVTAHSGTVCGIVFEGVPSVHAACDVSTLLRDFPEYAYMGIVPIISGGIDIEEGEI